ncbi:hypothetical protein AALA69_07640 [Eggerthellaceae bacterium 24-137]
MGRLTDADRAFISENFAELGATECARRLGCSRRSVYNHAPLAAGAAPLPEPAAPEAPGPEAAGPRRPSTLDELRALRAALADAVARAAPSALPGISKELRAVMAEIDKLEGDRDDDNPLGALAEAIAASM